MSDLEDAVIKFLGTIPKKRTANVREIAMGINGGKYPSMQTEKRIKEICASLWEHHLADEKLRRKPYYRLRKKKQLDFAARVVLKEKFKEDAIKILAKNREWMPKATVVDRLVGSGTERRDAMVYLARRAIGMLVKQGIAEAKNRGSNIKLRLRE